MLVRDPAVREVDILAHSMGNALVPETLRQMAIRDRRIPSKIDDVMLAAPDVDVDVFANEIADMGAPSSEIHFVRITGRQGSRALALGLGQRRSAGRN